MWSKIWRILHASLIAIYYILFGLLFAGGAYFWFLVIYIWYHLKF